ncbi:MAG: hypothetical protein R2705_12850 [Ilumatobacteraceae bacterium]
MPSIAPVDTIETPTVSDTSSTDPTFTLAAPENASSSVVLVVLVTLISVVPGLLLLTTTFPGS